jgi:hypothetical protein
LIESILALAVGIWLYRLGQKVCDLGKPDDPPDDTIGFRINRN